MAKLMAGHGRRGGRATLLALVLLVAASSEQPSGIAWAQMALRPAERHEQRAARPLHKVPPAASVVPPASSAANDTVRSLFTPRERQAVIGGLGNPVAQLLVLREVDRQFPLTERQWQEMLAYAKTASAKLIALRTQRTQQDRELEAALYGDKFDAAQVQPLIDAAAKSEQELLVSIAQTEIGFYQLLAGGNPRRARLARALFEQVVQAPRNRATPLPPPAFLVRPAAGQLRLLAEFIGDDWDLMIPGFGNPPAVLLILRQLELTDTQRADLKALAQEVRSEWLQEKEARDQQQQAARAPQAGVASVAPEDDVAESERPEVAPRPLRKTAEQLVAANAARKVSAMKRQARIETRIRQLLQPKQWTQYVALLRGITAPALAWNVPRAPLP